MKTVRISMRDVANGIYYSCDCDAAPERMVRQWLAATDSPAREASYVLYPAGADPDDYQEFFFVVPCGPRGCVSHAE